MGVAADSDIGPATVEDLVSIGRAVGALMLRLVMMVTATTIAGATAATIATAARPLTIVWSH
jgi:hypothetical protein